MSVVAEPVHQSAGASCLKSPVRHRPTWSARSPCSMSPSTCVTSARPGGRLTAWRSPSAVSRVEAVRAGRAGGTMHAVPRRLTIAVPVLLLCAVLAAIARSTARPIGDADLWWHLRLGSDLIRQHSLSAPADWAPAASQSWVPTEPLPEVVAVQFDHWFGLAGVAWLYALGLCLLLVSLYCTNRFRASAPAACVAALTAFLGAGLSLGERPQLLSLALIPVSLAAWFASERDLRPRWWLVPVTWLWSLIHGYWILCVGLGALMVVAILLDRRPGVRAAAGLVAVP